MGKKSWLAIVGPGILVAATGVGAGDLATAAFTGNRLGLAVLWAVALGAFLKFVLNEGLTRWQLATGDTLLEGCVANFGTLFSWAFLGYFFAWSWFVGLALMSACGATAHAILPIKSPELDKVVYGIAHSAVAVALISLGGYRLFERVMTLCIGVMFAVVVATAIALQPPVVDLVRGLLVPTIPRLMDDGLEWTIALMGGVGGTLTIVCYGYWIREEGREGPGDLRVCRLDLASGYVMTAAFGMAMLVIGMRTPQVAGGGASLLTQLADSLQGAFGPFGMVVKYAFLVGAWGAVFSSLLGVWQSLPYLFTDLCELTWPRAASNDRESFDGPPRTGGLEPPGRTEHARLERAGGQQPALRRRPKVNTWSRPYRIYLYLLAIVPACGLGLPFAEVQKAYAVIGAMVIPALAAILLYLNNRTSLIGARYRNHWVTNVVLVISLVFFVLAGALAIAAKFAS